MTHESFPTKYRPKLLEEMVGQPIASSILGTMLKEDKITRSILITGVFSSGKTTLARIIARYVNCLDRKEDGTPCFACRSCTAIDKGNHPDVREINAAESRGIDSVRDLIEQSMYSPMNGKYRIFILDEVHRFTDAAFPALLKPIEEPSPKTIFILCTTNREKIPKTIISRCQDIQLKKVSPEDCLIRLKQVCGYEEVDKITDDDLLKIAKAADGHPRNALSLLEQVVLFLNNKGSIPNIDEIASKYVDDVIRGLPGGMAFRYLYAMFEGKFQNAMRVLAGVENTELFLLKSIQALQQITYTLVSPSLVDNYYRRYLNDVGKLPLFTEHPDKAMFALREIMGQQLEAYGKAKSYVYDDRALMDFYTLSAILTMDKIEQGKI